MNTPDRILELLRKSLDHGDSVEIDGLGTFSLGSQGYEFTPQTQPQVFVAYVEEDLLFARRICESLRQAGCVPWLDKEKLLPGQNWPRSIDTLLKKDLLRDKILPFGLRLGEGDGGSAIWRRL